MDGSNQDYIEWRSHSGGAHRGEYSYPTGGEHQRNRIQGSHTFAASDHTASQQHQDTFSSPAMRVPDNLGGTAHGAWSQEQQSHIHPNVSGAMGTEEYQRFRQHSGYHNDSSYHNPSPENYSSTQAGYGNPFSPESSYASNTGNNPVAWQQQYPSGVVSSFQPPGGTDAYERQSFNGALSDPSLQYHQSYPRTAHPPHTAASMANNASTEAYPSSIEQEQQYLLAQHQQEMQIRMMHEQQQQHYAQGMQWNQGGAWHNHVPSHMAMHPHESHQSLTYGNNVMPGAHSQTGITQHNNYGTSYMRSDSQSEVGSKRARRPKREKDKNKPKRPLSAYNLFFKDERAKMLAALGIDRKSEDTVSKVDREEEKGSEYKRRKTENHNETDIKPSGVGFAPMAKQIGKKWKEIDEETLEKYKELAAKDMERYREEMEVYRKKQREGLERTRDDLEDAVPDETKQKYFVTNDLEDKTK